MKQIIKWGIKAGIAGISAILLISLFSYAYDFSGIHIVSKTGCTDYTWEPNQRKSSMNEGFAWMKMDKDGYNNSFPADDKVDVLLMGSSLQHGLEEGKIGLTDFIRL